MQAGYSGGDDGMETMDPGLTLEVDGFHYSQDEHGHAQRNDPDFRDPSRRTWTTTDPYGHLSYGITITHDGDSDETDGIYFDYLILEAHVALHSTLDCESGGFLQDFEYEVVRHDQAADALEGMIDGAIGWFSDNYPERFMEADDSGTMETLRADMRRDLEGTPTPEYPGDIE